MVTLDQIDKTVNPHWSDVYDGREGFALYGHDPQINPPEARLSKHALGLDTGCVFGGRLTALIHDRGAEQLLSVEARERYARPLYQDGDKDCDSRLRVN